MFRRIGLTLVLLAAVASAASAETIAGTVLSKSDRTPLAWYRVDVITGDGTVAAITTGQDGRFRFENPRMVWNAFQPRQTQDSYTVTRYTPGIGPFR